MSSLVQVQNISKSFDNNAVIKNISFDIPEGEVICILGQSGSGKSTLLRMIGGLEDADEGTIMVDNEEITGPAKNLVPGYDFINFVSQHFKLERFRTVKDNISSVISYYPDEDREARIQELLELCKLTEKAKSFPHELSGGQQQRVAIAMALADEPFLLLMDEPFSNLDVNMKTEIRGEIVDILKKAEVTVILVSHDPVDAMAIADRVMILENGEISQIDSPKELYENPKSSYAAQFLGPINYIQTNGSVEGVRPEHFVLSDSGTHEGKISQCLFMGMHYHLSVNSGIAESKLLIYSKEALPVGQSIRFDIEKGS
ncbi:ABC transporter ATP-binding protein [Reichenbachiella ulvae]|uniref:ABC transporter ATP-binding protein n=1 Tax=Reichenbachiella ulvae TaxID=2980104 RepID=A0ABT3CZF1_9BACT|nr:ABC transporter ATP-binding protein [Reichenbachiella ulvae]MCV9388894.1 ABC transporter ATP-binding protein [Reichenbachiella ulvae]